ncbi:MAG: ferrous iron transport protein B [Oligoflexia bacterium]|nr:ferrous iron transport protein B [Oligoflexia bacterium]
MAVTPAEGIPKSDSASLPVVILAGNPNSGKTTVFNALTGLHYKVANYPGVTVERKESELTLGEQRVKLVDLPGIYHFGGHSLDEQIATAALLGTVKGASHPNLVVCVLDASNLERNLYLASQLIDAQIPLILALNMIDLAERHGVSVKVELLSRKLGIAVIPLCAAQGKGMRELGDAILKALAEKPVAPRTGAWIPESCCYHKVAMQQGSAYRLKHNYQGPVSDLLLGSSILSASLTDHRGQLRAADEACVKELAQDGIDPLSFEATERYRWINKLIKETTSKQDTAAKRRSDRLDAIITHKFWGTLVFAVIMFTIFQAIFLWSSYPTDLIDRMVQLIGNWVGGLMSDGILKSLLVDGVIAGVGSVLVFIPQIAVLFFFLGILEDSGYLSRAAFLMDRIMRKFGLQGRAFIPLLSSFACAIPGIMSTRTIPSFSDRLATILIAPLMSCSARLPVYTLLIAAFIPSQMLWGIVSLQGVVLLSMYVLGVAAAAVISWILKKTLLRGEPTIFVMEMPVFRRPALIAVMRDVWDRIVLFIRSAGTVILAISLLLWFLATFPRGDVEHTFAGRIGQILEPVIQPLGYNWEIGVGLLASFAAREVFVSSLSTVYNVQDNDSGYHSLLEVLQNKHAAGSFTLATALSLMVFYVFACQCMSTLAVCRRETGSWKWPLVMFTYMTTLAYICAFITYRLALNFWG